MVSVVSRFKVQGGLEGAVRQAFRDRPRLADHAPPGFLGMEVFTDADDPTLFYLVTRWTDRASFDAWHKSEARRLSHKYMPNGLKLVSGFTQVTRLERLPFKGGSLPPEEVVADAVPVLAHFSTGAGRSPPGSRCHANLLGQGWMDALRKLHPDQRIFTFWDYFRDAFTRDDGIRIDHLLLSPSLAGRLVAAGVDRGVRGWEKTSDHAPTWVELK